MFTANVGSADRAIRVIAGLILVALTLMDIIGPFGWLGLIAIATGFIRFCPAYRILGIRTCKIDPQ